MNCLLPNSREVQAYGNAADWVYRHGLDPGTWSVEAPLTVTDVRHIHKLALDLVWDVAPHPQATPRERPGSFREHEIQPFPEGMQPPPFPERPRLVADWLTEVNRLQSSSPMLISARGRLEATKGADGAWRSSRVWVRAYKASRRRSRR